MSEHTPGPWRYVAVTDEDYDIEMMTPWIVNGDEAGMVMPPVGVIAGPDSAEADLRLIARAPAMQAALEAVEWIDLAVWEYCPWCLEKKIDGHAPDCQRQAALRPAAAGLR